MKIQTMVVAHFISVSLSMMHGFNYEQLIAGS